MRSTNGINLSLRTKIRFLIVLLLFIVPAKFFAQEPPPRPLRITVNNNLSFGAFYQGAAGGSVTVNADLSRTKTGDVVLLGMGFMFSPAVFLLTGTPGRVLSLLNSGDVFLSGSNGGTLRLQFTSSSPTSPFVLTTGTLLLYVGGTLTVGPPAANPPGTFSGTFNITLIQE